jgi:hypothetical protein
VCRAPKPLVNCRSGRRLRKSATRVAQARNLRCALGAFDQYSDTYSEEVDRRLERLGDSELFTEIKDDAIVDAAAEATGPPNELRAFDVGCGPGLTDALLADRFAS